MSKHHDFSDESNILTSTNQKYPEKSSDKTSPPPLSRPRKKISTHRCIQLCSMHPPAVQAGVLRFGLRRRRLPLVRADQLQGGQHRSAPESRQTPAAAAAAAPAAPAAAGRAHAPDVRRLRRQRGTPVRLLFVRFFQRTKKKPRSAISLRSESDRERQRDRECVYTRGRV